MDDSLKIRRSIRNWLLFFIVALVLSGLTAFPIESGLLWICSWWPDKNSMFYCWLKTSYDAIRVTNENYPFLAYGYDWLAFAHLVIATSFIGALKDPVRNIWIFEFGMIACVGIIPLAFIAGHIRHIPVFWSLLDCCFGIFGLIPLSICYRKARHLERISYKPY
jgi:hypothetical protein